MAKIVVFGLTKVEQGRTVEMVIPGMEHSNMVNMKMVQVYKLLVVEYMVHKVAEVVVVCKAELVVTVEPVVDNRYFVVAQKLLSVE
jgi:hypothetical protein